MTKLRNLHSPIPPLTLSWEDHFPLSTRKVFQNTQSFKGNAKPAEGHYLNTFRKDSGISKGQGQLLATPLRYPLSLYGIAGPTSLSSFPKTHKLKRVHNCKPQSQQISIIRVSANKYDETRRNTTKHDKTQPNTSRQTRQNPTRHKQTNKDKTTNLEEQGQNTNRKGTNQNRIHKETPTNTPTQTIQ